MDGFNRQNIFCLYTKEEEAHIDSLLDYMERLRNQLREAIGTDMEATYRAELLAVVRDVNEALNAPFHQETTIKQLLKPVQNDTTN